MGREIKVARSPGTTIPRIQAITVKPAETFIRGALVVTDANGLLTEVASAAAAAGARGVVGIALQSAFSALGYGMANDSQITVATDRQALCSVAIADTLVEFSARIELAGVIQTVNQNMIGVQYGVLKNVEWVVNQSDTTNKAVTITDIDSNLNIVYFKFLSTVMKLA